MKDASIMCPLAQIVSNTQSLSSNCLSFSLVHEEECKYQSLDYKRSAS